MNDAQNLQSADDPQRLALEHLLLEFDQSWHERLLEEKARRLTGDAAFRRLALLEMVKIDLEKQRQRGRKPTVEAYLHFHPELGTVDTAPAELLLAEFQARCQFGETADLTDFASRFPRQIDALRQLLLQSGAALPSVAPVAPQDAHGSLPPLLSRPEGTPELSGQVGRYRIVRLLGKGGMGAVYLARDTGLARDVALKVSRLLDRFRKEAVIAAHISHPNICRVYGFGEVNGLHFLTMEYVEGGTLAGLLEREKVLAPEHAAALVRKLALALEEAHRHGVIHRDLKPGNVLLRGGSEPVVTDFGLARLENDSRHTPSGTILGTPYYMSPEQARGAVRDIGAASDIYSLGVILYELLTGRVPFQGQPFVVMTQIIEAPPPRPTELRPGLDRQLEAVCLKAMAKAPGERFASMAAFAQALATCLEAVTVEYRPSTTESITAKPSQSERGASIRVATDTRKPSTLPAGPTVRRRRGTRVAALCVCLSLVVLGVGWTGTRFFFPRSDPIQSAGDDTSWTELFNGKDFSGWKTHPAQPGSWRIENGVLIGSGQTHSYLYSSRGDYEAFHLLVEARINEQGNSGVFFRCPFGPALPPEKPQNQGGYEAEILGSAVGRKTIGNLLNGWGEWLAGGDEAEVPSGQWFQLEVIARANHFVIKVNDKTLVDHSDDDQSYRRGHIAFQSLGPTTVCEFRRIAIKELPTKADAQSGTREAAGNRASFLPLFTGKDLKGWDSYGYDSNSKWSPDETLDARWSFADGVLTCTVPGRRMLATTRKDYTNFHLRARVSMDNPRTDSGIMFRGLFSDKRFYAHEAQLGDVPWSMTGSLWRYAPAQPSHHRVKVSEPCLWPGKWFTIEVIAQGPRIKVLIDGKLRADDLDKESPLLKGHIALQSPLDGSAVRFRKLEIKELP